MKQTQIGSKRKSPKEHLIALINNFNTDVLIHAHPKLYCLLLFKLELALRTFGN